MMFILAYRFFYRSEEPLTNHLLVSFFMRVVIAMWVTVLLAFKCRRQKTAKSTTGLSNSRKQYNRLYFCSGILFLSTCLFILAA